MCFSPHSRSVKEVLMICFVLENQCPHEGLLIIHLIVQYLLVILSPKKVFGFFSTGLWQCSIFFLVEMFHHR